MQLNDEFEKETQRIMRISNSADISKSYFCRQFQNPLCNKNTFGVCLPIELRRPNFTENPGVLILGWWLQ